MPINPNQIVDIIRREHNHDGVNSLSVSMTSITEVKELIPDPQTSVNGNATRSFQTNYDGGSFYLFNDCVMNRVILKVNSATGNPKLKFAIYQHPQGFNDIMNKIAEFTILNATAGIYVLPRDAGGSFNLKRGTVLFLFGKSATAGGSGAMRTYATLSVDLLNQNVDNDVHPVSFTTSLNVDVVPPATLDPKISGGILSPNTSELLAQWRLKNV